MIYDLGLEGTILVEIVARLKSVSLSDESRLLLMDVVDGKLSPDEAFFKIRESYSLIEGSSHMAFSHSAIAETTQEMVFGDT